MEKKADVIVPAGDDVGTVLRLVPAILENSGRALYRLILVCDSPAIPEALAALDHRQALGAAVEVLYHPTPLGKIDGFNRGIEHSQCDVVLLCCGHLVGPGWLRELALVAYSDERTACAAPLSENDVTREDSGGDPLTGAFVLDPSTVYEACVGLPRFTVTPVVERSCIYLRRDRIEAVGMLDASYDDVGAAVGDWVMRAQDLGFVAKRANRVFVRFPGPMPGEGSSALDASGRPILGERHSHFDRQAETFHGSLDGNLTAHAVRALATGKLRVAYDIRHLPIERVGTRTYALSLGRALGTLPEIDLALLVRSRDQARGLSGRVIVEDEWRDDVEVIHKPAQVIDPAELKLLFESSAHVVITYQDLIGYRIPLAFPTDESFEHYRGTSNLVLQAAQRLVAISRSAAGEIAAEFGVPGDEIAVVYHGVEASWFARRTDSDSWIKSQLGLPGRYFFSLATDFPHKNLHNLMEAYAILRSRWPDADPPQLVLAGYTSSARTRIYNNLRAAPPREGLKFLGPVSPEELRVLYQHALAFVFPSLYEGFGLTPLESMAAGTPVIAMPISAVPEVVGDCALYPEGMSALSLALAMETLARDRDLRDDLRQRGREHVDRFRWENTARATLQVYRDAVMHPTERSLRARRLLRDAILCWAEPISYGQHLQQASAAHHGNGTAPPGIRNACTALRLSLTARLRRELRRLRTIAPRTPGALPQPHDPVQISTAASSPPASESKVLLNQYREVEV